MSLEQELQSEQVAHLDLSGFCRMAAGTKVRDVLAQMRQEGHNVCLVTSSDKLVGILTDRDILRKVVADPETLEAAVDDVMTSDPVTIEPQTTAIEALTLMDEHRFRNLPVISEKGEIVGDMTHQAFIHFLAARYPVEVLNRPPRADQFPRKQEGG